MHLGRNQGRAFQLVCISYCKHTGKEKPDSEHVSFIFCFNCASCKTLGARPKTVSTIPRLWSFASLRVGAEPSKWASCVWRHPFQVWTHRIEEKLKQRGPRLQANKCTYTTLIHLSNEPNRSNRSNLSIHPSIHPSICLSIYPSIHLSIYPSIYLSIYQSVYLSIYLSIYLYSDSYPYSYLSYLSYLSYVSYVSYPSYLSYLSYVMYPIYPIYIQSIYLIYEIYLINLSDLSFYLPIYII